MFHRMKSEAPQPQNSQPAQPAKPAATQPPQQEAARFADFSQFQRPATEQDRTPAKTAESRPQAAAQQQPSPVQSQPQTSQQTNQQQEEKVMTTQTQTASNPSQSNAEYSAPRALDAAAAPYARAGQTGAMTRPGAGFPGAYPAAAYPAGPRDQLQAPAEERKLTIGRGITISGEIDSCDLILVEGTVEAVLKGAKILDIAESGTFYGTVEMEEASIAGRFEGDITCTGRLTVRSTGIIIGTISYKELELEAGAVVEGRLTPMGAQTESRKQQHQTKKKTAQQKDHQGAANNVEGGLFTAKAAAE